MNHFFHFVLMRGQALFSPVWSSSFRFFSFSFCLQDATGTVLSYYKDAGLWAGRAGWSWCMHMRPGRSRMGVNAGSLGS